MIKIKLPFDWYAYIFISKIEDLNKESKKLKLFFDYGIEHKEKGFMKFIKQVSPKPDMFIIWVDDSYEDFKYVLIHEIHHLAFDFSQHLGIDDEEFRAYLTEDICKQLNIFDYKK